MGKIKSIDVKTTKMLVEELKISMQKTLNKYGLKVESEGGKIGVENLDANLKFNISVVGTGGGNAAKEAEFDYLSKSIGLNCEYGFEFIGSKGEPLKVTGISPRRSKFPVDLENTANGKSLKAPVSYVNRMMLVSV